jgi:3-hydroxybutyryl-CoA dehydrogenase
MEIGVMIEKGARVGVVGAGAMGTEIAFCFALAGFDVVVYDNDGKKLENLMLRGAAIYDKGVARGSYEAEHRAAVLTSLSCTQDIGNLLACELVTEAVFENEDVKAAVLRQLDGICDVRCVIATNTSTIPISVLSSAPTISRRYRA